jgi:hypothetical protein
MVSIVEIRAATTSVVCDERGVAQHVINVHNTSGRKLRIGARVHAEAPAKAGWIGDVYLPANAQQTEWDLDPDKTVQLTVPIQAGDADPGTYTFKVEVYSTDAPSEDYTTGDGIAFEVQEKKAPDPQPEKKPFPWWIIIVVVAVLVVGGLGGWAIYHVTRPVVPDVIDKSRTDAEAAIVGAELTVGKVDSVVSADAAAGTVLQQTPEAGKRVSTGTAVDLVVAEAAAVPDPDPTPPGIHKQGNFNVRQTWSGDLDTGTETSNGADFWFRAETATRRYLEPKGGATFRLMGSDRPDYFECRDASLSADRIDVNRIAAGNWMCVKTSDGRVAMMVLVSQVGPSPGVMRIRYTTWKKPLAIFRPVLELRQPVLEVQPR